MPGTVTMEASPELKTILRNFSRVADDVGLKFAVRGVQDAMQPLANSLRDQLKAKVPVRTGDLRRRIRNSRGLRNEVIFMRVNARSTRREKLLALEGEDKLIRSVYEPNAARIQNYMLNTVADRLANELLKQWRRGIAARQRSR